MTLFGQSLARCLQTTEIKTDNLLIKRPITIETFLNGNDKLRFKTKMSDQHF